MMGKCWNKRIFHNWILSSFVNFTWPNLPQVSRKLVALTTFQNPITCYFARQQPISLDRKWWLIQLQFLKPQLNYN